MTGCSSAQRQTPDGVREAAKSAVEGAVAGADGGAGIEIERGAEFLSKLRNRNAVAVQGATAIDEGRRTRGGGHVKGYCTELKIGDCRLKDEEMKNEGRVEMPAGDMEGAGGVGVLRLRLPCAQRKAGCAQDDKRLLSGCNRE